MRGAGSGGTGNRAAGERAGADRLEFLALLSLFGFCVTQPTLDLLGRHPQFFAARAANGAEVFFLVALLSLGAPVIAFALIRACGAIRPALGRGAYRAFVTLGAALFVLLALKRIPDLGGDFRWLGFALLAGAAFAGAHARFAAIRLFLRILAPAPLIFAAVFLAGPAMRAFLRGDGPSAAKVQIGSPAPVVMVVFDELPLDTLLDETGGIDGRRFPHFAELAQAADWYRNATTVADSTELSVPAILSGRYPESIDGRVATSADFPETLFTLLGRHYDLRVIESATSLCPPSLCTPIRDGWATSLASLGLDVSTLYLHLTLPSGLARRLPRVDQTWRDFVRFADFPAVSAKNPVEAFSSFLDSIQPGPRPAFSFIHLQLPHVPWVFLPSGKQYLPWRIDYTSPNVWDQQAALVELGFQRHVLQTMLVDRLLGRLLRRLKDLSRYDETLLVVLSDHGASFRPGKDRRAATSGNLRDIASVPLIIKAPGQREGRVLDVNAQTVDVAPTVADVLGVDPVWPFDGRSLFEGPGAGPPLKTVFRGSRASPLVLSPDLSAVEGAVLCGDGAPALEVESGSLKAHLDNVAPRENRIWFGGWAADLERKRPAGSILVFADGRLVFRGQTGLPRQDVETAFPGRGPANAGFAFGVDSAELPEGAEVRVIAVAEGKAAEVRYPSDFPWRPRIPSQPQTNADCDPDAETRLVRVWRDAGDAGHWPDRLVELAASSNDTGLFRFPPCGRLVGSDVSEPETVHPDWFALLDDPEAFRRVDPAAGHVPAAVLGTLATTGQPLPEQIAVALDGVVAGLAPTFLSPEGERRFLVPTPEDLLRPGANLVVLYAVVEDECRLAGIGAGTRSPISK